MGERRCCLSRGPPSPDGFPPRQIIAVSDDDPKKSWGSRFSKPEDAAELQAIFKNDSYDLQASPASNRLGAVKSRLRKHLSRDSGLSKRRPRSSVGNSEEEVARREELKRIRKKRIQDELGDSGVYDEDAQSLCTSPFEPASRPTIANLGENSQNASIDHSPGRETKSSRDTNRNPLRRASTPEIPASPVLKPQSLSIIDDPAIRHASWRLSFSSDRRSSCLRALSQGNSEYSNKDHNSQLDSMSPVVSTNQVKWPKNQGLRLPSQALADEDLQYVALQEATRTQSMGLEDVDGNIEPARAIPLHEMRISQRLASGDLLSHPSSSQPSMHRGDSHDSEFSSPDEGFRAINIRRSRYFQATSSSGLAESEIPTSWGQIIPNGTSSIHKSGGDNGPRPTQRSLRRLTPSLSSSEGCDTMAKDHQVPLVVVTDPDYAPINHPPNEQDQRPKNKTRIFRKSESDISSASFFARQANINEHQHDPDTVETRHPDALDRCETSASVISRFTEDFDEPTSKSSMRSSFFSAIGLPRLGRLATRSYDGSGPIIPKHENPLSVPPSQTLGHKLSLPKDDAPAHAISNIELVPSSYWKYSAMDSTERMWNRVIRQSFDPSVRGIQREIDLIPPGPITNSSEYSELKPKSHRSNETSLEALTDNGEPDETSSLTLNPPTMQVPTIIFQGQDSEGINIVQNLLSGQIAKQEIQARKSPSSTTQASPVRRESPISRGRSFMRPAIPPKSWARYPSHIRERRFNSAGSDDKADPTDFSIKKLDDDKVKHATGTRKNHHSHSDKYDRHSLPERLTMKLRTSLEKLHTKRSTTLNEAVYSAGAGGTPREPELEILPYRVSDLEKLPLEAYLEMKWKERKSRMAAYSDNANSCDGLHDDTEISIGDSRFYDDCVEEGRSVRSAGTLEELASPDMTDKETSRRARFGTWSGRDRKQMADVAMATLRQSTVDFTKQVELMENVERERALRAADEAFARTALL